MHPSTELTTVPSIALEIIPTALVYDPIERTLINVSRQSASPIRFPHPLLHCAWRSVPAERVGFLYYHSYWTFLPSNTTIESREHAL